MDKDHQGRRRPIYASQPVLPPGGLGLLYRVPTEAAQEEEETLGAYI